MADTTSRQWTYRNWKSTGVGRYETESDSEGEETRSDNSKLKVKVLCYSSRLSRSLNYSTENVVLVFLKFICFDNLIDVFEVDLNNIKNLICVTKSSKYIMMQTLYYHINSKKCTFFINTCFLTKKAFLTAESSKLSLLDTTKPTLSSWSTQAGT